MARVSKRLRYEILRRDGFKCRYCGTTAEAAELRVDHVIPEALGGPSDPSNLATSCEPCNSGKTSTTPDAPVVDQVAESALRWTRSMQAAAAAMEKEIIARRDRYAWFADVWKAYKLNNGKDIPLPPDWEDGILRLESAGLTYLLFEEAAAAAMRAYGVLPENRFRYFCGVAWNMVTKLQERAGGTIESASGPDEPSPSTDALQAELWYLEDAAAMFLGRLPEWLREYAEREAKEMLAESGDENPTNADFLTIALKYVGDVLAASDIELRREGGN